MVNALGLIFAYSDGSGMRELTEPRATASIPFCGRYRAIDFMLSNMVNASITSVGIIMREGYQSLLDHLGTGKDWELSRKIGGIAFLPPFGYTHWFDLPGMGKIDALKRNENYIQNNRQKYAVIGDAHVIANIKLDDVMDAHMAGGSDVTVVCSENAGIPEKSTYFMTDPDGSVRDIFYRPERAYPVESLGLYIMERELLLEMIACGTSRNMVYLENEVLRAMLPDLKVKTWMHSGYVCVMHTTQKYFADSMRLLDNHVRRDLFNRENPVYTRIRDEAPTYYGDLSRTRNSLITDGCRIEGAVENSILFRGVTVAPGASVKNCILMQGTSVADAASLEYVITDKFVSISKGSSIMGSALFPVVIGKGKSV